jgi:hypothetical protein
MRGTDPFRPPHGRVIRRRAALRRARRVPGTSRTFRSRIVVAIVVMSTKMPNAIKPPPMLQALAMAVYGPNIGFGLTPAQALKPNGFTGDPAE